MGKKKKRVIVRRLNWDAEFLHDMKNGEGFVISEPPTLNIDDKTYKPLYGPRSELYGTTAEDEDAFAERHRCKCGKIYGRMNDGEFCTRCNSYVENRGLNIKFTGYIYVGEYIINPFYYYKMAGIFGEAVLNEIVWEKHEVDIDGNVHDVTDFEALDIKPKSPFFGIGIKSLRNRFDEVLDYFKGKKPKKAEDIERLKKEKINVFCKFIPVYSTALRPQSLTSDTYYYTKIDTLVNTIYSLSELVKKSNDLQNANNLSRIQSKVNKLWKINIALMNGKEGIIRGLIEGGEINFSARNVVVPGINLRNDEVVLSYHTALTLLKSRIEYYLKTMSGENKSLYQIENQIKQASIKFDSQIYAIMEYILKTEKSRIIINRNPTLSIESIVLLKIKAIKKDINDYTLTIPLSALIGMNCDFDGDVLNIKYLPLPEMVEIYKNFNPVKKYTISRDTGNINKNIVISKSPLVTNIVFNTI